MQLGKPSRTALAVAAHRAAHQSAGGRRVFTDPLAVQILCGQVDLDHGGVHRERIRMWVAMRTRIAEDALAAAVEHGTRQLVMLGAGLDTFAYRNPFAGLRVFEVDHPATQAWKRECLDRAGIRIPDSLKFAPVDFERETLAGALDAAGFDPGRETFFNWLGVVPYLAKEAVWLTLRDIGGLAGGAQVIFDYADPPETLEPEQREFARKMADRVAGAGEPFVSYFTAEELDQKLRELGYREIEDLGPRQVLSRFFPRAPLPPGNRGGHVLRAANMTQ